MAFDNVTFTLTVNNNVMGKKWVRYTVVTAPKKSKPEFLLRNATVMQQYSVKPMTLRLVGQAWLAPIYLDKNRPALQKPLEKAMRAAFNYVRVILTCQGHPDSRQDVTEGVRYSLTRVSQNEPKPT